MCGIAGFFNLKNSREERERTIRRMTDRMRDRGPDAEGAAFYAFPAAGGQGEDASCDITFGHRRLAIIDLTETGAQPMESRSGRFSVVYNGEIYNHREIAKTLEDEGKILPSNWRGTSDTEILLEAIEAWGMADTLKKCRGMLAIAVLDHETGQITLARDRVGEKPLYYGFVNGCFVFASDIGCLTEMPGFRNDINRAVLPLYFIHGYIPAPYTIWQDIWKLEPGTMLTVDAPYRYFDPSEELDALQRKGYTAGSARSGQGHTYTVWWSMRETAELGLRHPFQGSFTEAGEELERILTASIRRQMIADVPLGAFLSAGIDSSTIVALMQKIAREDGGEPARTFTIGMREQGFDEAPIAAEIAAHLGTRHTEKYISKEDALQVIPKLARMFGEPFADSSQIPTFLVSAMTREHVTVSLSGDAGDELFCGYTSYFSIRRIWNKMRGIPAPVRKLTSAALIGLPAVKREEIRRTKATLLAAGRPIDLHRLESDHDPVIRQIALPVSGGGALPHKLTQFADPDPHLWPYGTEEWECARESMLADLVFYHPDDILVKVDRCAMANSLETRVPLLDPDVLAFAWSLPTEYLVERVTGGDGSTDYVGKRVLREVLYRYVPRELMERPKKGFGIPIEQWLLEEPLRSWAEELLDPERIRREGLLDVRVVEKLWKDYTERGSWCVQIWYLLMFEEFMNMIGERGAA
ncbi:MAG: asparagine synthase (glutamine-hydrolyzing) [Lachnospiraceae bacterium]|nr:asparagine synthase (glutamine-hydrolyzing) [Lachnospiraceae bacterium]